jgi:hypothetical protein
MVQGVLLDEAIEVLFQGTGYFGRSTGARAVEEARGPCMGKAMDPFAEGGISKRKCVGDRLQVGAFDDCTNRLGASADAGLVRLLQHGIQGGEGVIGKVELEGPHGIVLPYKVLQKFDNRSRHWAAIFLP